MNRSLRKTPILAIALAGAICLLGGCIGADRPRRIRRGSERFTKLPPPPPSRDPDANVPAALLRADLDYSKSRQAIRRASSTPYKNSWNANDRDQDRVVKQKGRKKP